MNEKLPGIRPKENRNLKKKKTAIIFIYVELQCNRRDKNGK